MNYSIKFSLVLVLVFFETIASALPIGFGRNLRKLEYEEIVTPDFYIYYDKRTPNEGRVVANAAEAAKPILDRWFEISRTKPLPIILSSTTSNASFANFITDVLELQTMGQGGRDLVWHEYTHNMMYQHLDNIFGPTGAIVHLPWMPAWWLEGLAEATSVSVGSDIMYGFERTIALENSWPTYDKLHSLYNTDFSLVGYSVSGGFVSYILRTYGADTLSKIMEDFFDYTLPWWWPWSVVPFNDFMPLDAALANHTGKTGEELYEEYKFKATAYWRSRYGNNFMRPGTISRLNATKTVLQPGKRLVTPLGLQVRNFELFDVRKTDDLTAEYKLGWTKGLPSRDVKVTDLPNEITFQRITYGGLKIITKRENNEDREPFYTFYEVKKKGMIKKLVRNAFVERLFLTEKDVFWLENLREITQLCSLPRELFLQPAKVKKKPTCYLTSRFPISLSYMGEKFNQTSTSIEEIWLSRTTETLYGDRYEILKFDTKTKKATPLAQPLGGKPISVAENNQGIFVLTAGHTDHYIRQHSKAGRCQQEFPLGNLAANIYALGQDQLGLTIRSVRSKSFYLVKRNISQFKKRPCSISSRPISPLQYAMSFPKSTMTQALRAIDPWKTSTANVKQEQKIVKSQPLNSYPRLYESNAAVYRPRPVFSFPWIGADARGYQFGAISVPLMDHLQNETLSLTTLYGIDSNYPNLELTLTSTRFATTFIASAFRRQSWNGVYTRTGESFYFDERGFQLSAGRYIYPLKLNLQGGYKSAWMLPYLGDPALWELLAHGYVNEFFLTASQGWSIGNNYLSYSIYSLVAPEEINDNFKYDKLSLRMNYSIPIRFPSMRTVQSLGLTYGRTRGKRRPFRREIYRPLKTFIPGSGGGYNQINVGILGPGFLTAALYGDTQARFNWSWTFPLIRQLDYLIHIFYLERLDFTAFFNYGYAWNQQIDPHPSDFIKAHGYNLDLQSDIKGVTVNLGMGTGQVFDQKWEVYFKFGFDALIGN